MTFHKRLEPGKQRKNKKKIYGFDIETDMNDKNTFICASVYGDDYQKRLKNKQECIDEFKHARYRNSIIAATNLGFDFFGTFMGTLEIQQFNLLFRGSFLLYARTWLDGSSQFFRKSLTSQKAHGTMTFLDTLNYAHMSVEQMGEVLKIPKIDIGDKIGTVPQNDAEWDAMFEYNMQDARISQQFMKFLYAAFEELGATPKLTIASTSMSLFRNVYLDGTYYLQNTEDIIEIMQGYYGGRTETFKRGIIRERYYYDINSAYPHAMTKPLPDPNTHRVTHKNVLDYIMNYEGMSEVKIICPENLPIPYLPFKYDGLLLFPTGNFSGWYTHFELRKALSMGYIITEVLKTHYYLKTCVPLKKYAQDIYERRKTRKNTPMGMVDKLMLNSLYGKFGQRFTDREDYQPISKYAPKDLEELDDFEIIGDFIKSKKDTQPSCFCIPIWAAYITAYTRDQWFGFATQCDPDYGDTDSIITSKEMSTSDELGDFKLEMKIKEGLIVRNKMYALIDSENKEHVKIKGIMKRVKAIPGGKTGKMTYKMFSQLEFNNVLYYDKFMKFKEANRRGFKVNEVIEIAKELDLDDAKRQWPGSFSFNELQKSRPLHLIDGIPEAKIKEIMLKIRYENERRVEKEMKEYIKSERFDKGAVGCDISDEEFIKNEQWFDRHGY